MEDEAILAYRQDVERRKALLLEQAAALDREMADIELVRRIAAKHNLTVTIQPNKPASMQDAPTSDSVTEMVVRSTNVQGPVSSSDATIENLVDHYLTDPQSSFHSKRFRSRSHAEGLFRTIKNDLGSRTVRELHAEDIVAVHKVWTDRVVAKGKGDGKAMAYALISQLRSLLIYGGKLGDNECVRLSFALRRLRIKNRKPRKSRLISAAEAEAIIAKAHEEGLHSIALAQAIQFDCKLKQRDVIGEWVPETEPGDSNIRDNGKKWLRGIVWDKVDRGLILRHTTSRWLKNVVIDLKLCPRVMKEFDALHLSGSQSSGPIIVSETSGLPWHEASFRRYWRMLADKAGVPDDVKNMDSGGSATDGPDVDKTDVGRQESPNINGHAKVAEFVIPKGAA